MARRSRLAPSRSFATSLATSFAASLLASVFFLPLDVRSAPAADGPLVVARAMDVNSLDPARAYCDTCQIYLSAVYATLLTLAPDNQTIIPMLTKSWEVSPDVTTFTFHLDPAATFSDGSPVTAQDVKWSLERLKNIKGGPAYLMDSLKSIEAKDPATVVITTQTPNSEFLGILAAPYTGIINAKLASANGANANADAATSDASDTWFLAHSAGAGPFVLESYTADDSLRLARNDTYWGKKAGVPGVVLKQTADAVTQAQMLQSGTADIAMQIDPDTAKTVSAPDATFTSVPSFNFVYAAISPAAKGAPVPLTSDVRQAIALALDYKGAIDFTVGGEGKEQSSAIPNGYPGTKDLPAPVTNVEKAKELLAKAGHPDGFAMELEFPAMNVYGVDLSLLAQKVQQDLGKVGIKLSLKPVPFTVWISDINDPGTPFALGFFAPDYFGSAQYVQYFGMLPDMPWANRAGVGKEPGLDGKEQLALYHKALAATDVPAQEAAYRDLALKMIDDKIILPLVSPNLILAYRNDVSGVRYSACCNLPLGEIEKK
ncbi:ABC transporter substrate-binding protein [Ancylobacter amanitiformis]|uniref:Peptide/nickel transport system substrate-binding protein n=1 Tax=Ancylobacter amanitiformis TaxID=217069 RepID=A0ABU0LT01_9HYPH|nr:ABC transporter substrate-binding protein [Ancylobacter amanitiformis]MDQ0511818.1 peptide/nickel transport system substrate-binding protein [Ancylobacter amanitiformis]